jgi:hypothetical protein
LFTLWRLQAKTKILNNTIRELLFVDDCALNASTKNAFQLIISKYSEACSNFGLIINMDTTEIMYQPAPGKIYTETAILVNGANMRFVKISHTLTALHYRMSPLMMR